MADRQASPGQNEHVHICTHSSLFSAWGIVWVVPQCAISPYAACFFFTVNPGIQPYCSTAALVPPILNLGLVTSQSCIVWNNSFGAYRMVRVSR